MAEFDRIAADYSAGFDDPIKRIFGDSAKSGRQRLFASELRTADTPSCLVCGTEYHSQRH